MQLNKPRVYRRPILGRWLSHLIHIEHLLPQVVVYFCLGLLGWPAVPLVERALLGSSVRAVISLVLSLLYNL